MNDVQLILMHKDDTTYLYGELINGRIYCGKERSIHKDDLVFSPDVPESWRAYAVNNTFPIITNTPVEIKFYIEAITSIATTKEGYVMPLFAGRLKKNDDSYAWSTLYATLPKLLIRPVTPVKQPPVVGPAPRVSKSLAEQQHEQKEREMNKTSAERAEERAVAEQWERACGIAPIVKKKKGWFS